ncbi:MAG: M20 family metallopeptidase [Nannocystaceae bacterium]|nr:amidohydrolase [bacterium]
MSTLLFSPDALTERLETLVPELTEARHDIHKHPELGFEETRTQAKIKAWLESLGYEPCVSAQTGLVADVRPDLGTPTLALRADIDCLPMHEHTDLPYRSVHDGKAHKCGHDGHTAVLMGVAKLLSEKRDALPANVRLLFQPAEEGVRGGGAKVMVAEGALEGVKEVYALHNWPGYPHGEVRVRAGTMMAATAEFEVTVTGVGGHGSQPQHCRDPIVAAAGIVSALQTVVSRGISSEGGAVVSVCQFHGGTANNVIPDEVRLSGTIRTFDPAVTEVVFDRIREVVRGSASTFGVQAQVEIHPDYPVLVNDAECTAAVERVATAIVGPDNVTSDELPMAGGEDFAYMAQAIPAAYFFVGTGNDELTSPVCHHPDFDFADSIIPLAVRMFMGLVEDRL